MRRAHVVVVGGGPAGSTAAWRLARAGRRVVVCDAARFPRVKLCAGWVTRAALADLELEPARYPHTLQPFSTVSLAVGDAEHETRWAGTASFGIVRAEFDDFLLRRAAAAGAEVCEGTRVRAVQAVPGGVEVTVDGGDVLRADVVVGAGGHGCPVARTLGAIDPAEAVVVTQESETRVGAERLRALTPRAGSPELIAEPDFRGYGWYFTKGDFLNVGVGAVGGAPIRQRLARLLARLRASGRLPADLALTPFRGHAYAVWRGRPRRLGDGRVVLAGDAAGLARDLSGEGIGPAIRSGVLAAESILEGRADGYPERIVAAFGAPGGAFARLVAALPAFLAVAAARLACTRPGLRRRLVLEGAFGMG
jgi:geranylgeranyl reductase family protein